MTLATISFQNYFRLYEKLAGMTGTAMTEANEFWKIYKLDVVAIPTNKPLIRINSPDMIYRTEPEKWEAIIEEIKEASDGGRPVLVGTTSVEKSEMLSAKLKQKYGVQHEVLNAKQHEREAQIVLIAGQQHKNAHGETVGNVTIATNMAGRGTVIILGGNPEFIAWATISASRATFSGFAFSSSCLIPRRLSMPDSFSLLATSVVPMRIGRFDLWTSSISVTTAFHFSPSVR